MEGYGYTDYTEEEWYIKANDAYTESREADEY